jgi:hypothetical protein
MLPVQALLQASASAPTLTSGVVSYLTTISAIGVVTMALIQTAKDMLPIRRWFQANRFRVWLRQGAAEAEAPDRASVLAGEGGAGMRLDPVAAEHRVIALATDGDGDALYDLPIEQMCGQINAALQLVLEFPARDRNLVAMVASQSSPADLTALFNAASGAAAAVDAPGVAEARTRVMHQFQRAIDAFQIAASYRWKLWMQIASLVLCGGLTYIAMLANFHVGTSYVGGVGAVLLGAVLAGFLAPVARDITAAVQSLRK